MAIRIVRMSEAGRGGQVVTRCPTPFEMSHGIATVSVIQLTPRAGKGPAVFGGYYHRNNRARFVVVSGCGTLQSQEMNLESKSQGMPDITSVGSNTFLVIEPYTAFQLVVDVPAVLVVFDTRSFNEHDEASYDGLEIPGCSIRATYALHEMGLIDRSVSDRFYEFGPLYPPGNKGVLDVQERTIIVNERRIGFNNNTLGWALMCTAELLGVEL